MNHETMDERSLAEWLAALEQRAADHYYQTGRPLVTLSYAQSLDGCIAAQQGTQTLISGADSMRITHQLRVAHHAILVGIGTILADNPRLTVRLVPGKSPQPVILDQRLRIPLDARVIDHPSPPWIFHGADAPREKIQALSKKGVRLSEVPFDNLNLKPKPAKAETPGLPGQTDQGESEAIPRSLSLSSVLEKLGQAGIRSLMVEGGGQVITSFLAGGWVDWAVITIAPVFLGGVRAVGLSLSKSPGPGQNLFPRVNPMQTVRVGDDLVIWGPVILA